MSLPISSVWPTRLTPNRHVDCVQCAVGFCEALLGFIAAAGHPALGRAATHRRKRKNALRETAPSETGQSNVEGQYASNSRSSHDHERHTAAGYSQPEKDPLD